MHADPVTVSAADAVKNAELTLARIIDRLPDLIEQEGLPGFAPEGSLYFYTHPKFGDLLHEPYFRLPVGVRYKLNDYVELHTELDGYFTHGLRHNVGNGLYQASVGLKEEVPLPHETGASLGLDFTSPLSRPPIGITDGLRHTTPYLTLSRRIIPDPAVVGFVTVGADLIDHTMIPPYYYKNEMRANSLSLEVGAAREWRHVNVILKLTDSNTQLMSHVRENAFGFRPSVIFPFLVRPDGTPRVTASFEGRTVWGPDGFESGITTSIRIDWRYRNFGTQ